MEAEGGQTAPAARMTLSGGAGAGKRNPSLRAGIAVRPPPTAGTLCCTNARRLRPWLPFAALSVVVAVLAAARLFRPSTPDKTNELDEANEPRPPVVLAPSPWANASSLEAYRHALHVEASVVSCPDRCGVWYVVAPEADPSAVAGIPATPEYADCWQGVLLASAVGKADDGPHDVQAESFHFFKDAAMVARIREGLEHPAGP